MTFIPQDIGLIIYQYYMDIYIREKCKIQMKNIQMEMYKLRFFYS